MTIYYTARAALAADEAAKAAEKSVANAEADAAEQAERFKQQLKIAKDSVDAARASVIATDRAWLELKVKVSGPLVFEGDDVSITVTCVCKNIGRAPASGIVWATDIFASAGDAFAYAMDRTRYNFIGATSSMGDVMFPAAKTNHTITLTMSRAKFIEDCEALANNPELEWGAARSWPHIVVGVHYALPGDNRRRFTHQAYYLARRHDGDGDFDGSEGRLEKGEIELVPSNMSLPIT